MNTVLAQECIRYNKLVDVMELTLPQLDKALQGLVVMSGELEAMGQSIALGQVPGAWEAKAYPSLKPLGPWTDDLMLRLDFVRDWIAKGIPVTFWISGFYFPQAFLTGSMQNYARSKQYPIDTIAFVPASRATPFLRPDGVDATPVRQTRWWVVLCPISS